MPDSLGSQVAVNTAKIAALAVETDRLRERCHALEADREAIRLLTRQVAELQDGLPHLARQAAREAVAEARRARHADFFANLRTYAVIVSATVALTALIVTLVLRG